MSQDYLTRIQNTINYREKMEMLKQECEKLQELQEINMDSCDHEILITFGQKVEERVFGTFQKYYCLLCLKTIKRYLCNNNLNTKKGSIIIDLENQLSDLSIVNDVLLLFQNIIKDYLKENENISYEEIENYLYSIDINELLPKVKKIK